jgi:hypothetical protein
VSRDIPASTKNSVSKGIPVQTIQSARIFPYKKFSQQVYSSTKYSVSKDILVQIFNHNQPDTHAIARGDGKHRDVVEVFVGLVGMREEDHLLGKKGLKKEGSEVK